MKSKLKKPIDTAKMKVSAYTVKLKTDLASLAVLLPEERPTPFVLHLNYGFADEESVLFLVGMSNDWKKFVRAEGWLKSPLIKQTWLGTCERKGEDMHLLVKKGKIVRSQFNAAIKQNPALKKLNWVIVEEISDEEDDDLLNETAEVAAEDVVQAAENKADKAKADVINANLVKLIPNLKGATAENRRVLLSQIEKLADALYAIPKWEAYTDDRIEHYLQQIEAFLAQQDKAETEEQGAKESSADKAKAEGLSKQLATLLSGYKKAADAGEKQKLMAEMQAAAALLYAVPKWQDYTDDRLEAILAQLPKAKPTAAGEADDRFISEHKALVNEMTTVDEVAAHSGRVLELASTPAQKAFAATLSDYAAHLAKANELINQNLDAQEQLAEYIASTTATAEERQQAEAALLSLEASLNQLLN
jgi:hypothetical protein